MFNILRFLYLLNIAISISYEKKMAALKNSKLSSLLILESLANILSIFTRRNPFLFSEYLTEITGIIISYLIANF